MNETKGARLRHYAHNACLGVTPLVVKGDYQAMQIKWLAAQLDAIGNLTDEQLELVLNTSSDDLDYTRVKHYRKV